MVKETSESKKTIDQLKEKARRFKRSLTRSYYTDKLLRAFGENGYFSKAVREAVLNGANVNAVHPRYKQSLLMLATRREDTDMMRFALDHGANVNLKNADGRTALMMAMPKKVEISRFLIENGADVTAKSHDGRYVVDWAALFGRDDQIQILLDKNAPFSDSSLLSAVVNGNTRSVKLLLQAGANVHAENHDHERMVVIAAKKGFVNMLNELLKKETDVSTIYQALQSALERDSHAQTITALKKALKREQDKANTQIMQKQLKKGQTR